MLADLAVAVVTHDARRRLAETLDALAADPDHERWDVVVVDNASRDGSLETLRGRSGVRVLRNDVGRGYAGALNQAISATTAPFIAVMTAGTISQPSALSVLVSELAAHPGCAAAGPLIRHPDGRIQRHGLFVPRAFTAFVVLSGLSALGPFRSEAERYYGRHEPGPAIEVDQLTGACLVLRRAAYDDVGPFDAERFFLYCEDVDWCLRARERGWRLRFVPRAEVVRSKSMSARAESAATIRLYYRSLRRFYGKHTARRHPAILRPVLYAAAYAKESVALAANALRREKGLRY